MSIISPVNDMLNNAYTGQQRCRGNVQYREALQQRRQEAVATAAIEALTKDSILDRRDVKTLVKTHKQQAKDKKGQVAVESKLKK
ncbi:unnamed protein product [Nippostrongylus brasiliensis]|uniref:Protein stum (inferred by orthology to a D. melanogaster protein) n=1 Tax=Nippostrongylus brasiliensis TaxID=27835 RepID=A0A0N4YEK7_NIPBR|nr:unnamed protein product [Nippostrongylus brasiliensis]